MMKDQRDIYLERAASLASTAVALMRDVIAGNNSLVLADAALYLEQASEELSTALEG
jgi:hypothetical protein